MNARVLCLGLASWLIAACGSNEGLFGGNSGSADGGGGAGTTAPSSSQTSGDPSSSEASTGGGGAASTTSGMGGAPDTSTQQSSTTGAGGSSSIECGLSSCPLGGDNACCWDLYLQYGNPQAECVIGDPANDGCSTSVPRELGEPGVETRIECQTTSQCGGGAVCCGHRESFFFQQMEYTYYETLTCQNTCNWPDITMCDDLGWSSNCPDVQTPNGPVQGTCKASTLLPPGYIVCGTP
jgi:hypothetical protein